MVAVYDEIGVDYSTARRPDPRIGARVRALLGDARTVVNVGAGTGSYEPPETVLAVDPSSVMLRQRPTGSALAVRARAEALPLGDGSVDAAMAVLTVHHWDGVEAGIAELRRVARRRVLVLTCDQTVFLRFWLLREYLPELAAVDGTRLLPIDRLQTLLGGARVHPVPVPHDCVDGFAAAYWRRPRAYLDPRVRAGISLFAQAHPAALRPGLDRLAADLESGRWQRRHQDLLRHEELDLGYRLLVAEP